MKRPDAIKLVREIGKHFPGVVPTAPETLEAWAETLEGEDAGQVQAAARRLMRETESIFPGTNLGAMLRNRANPLCSAATVEANLYRALEMFRHPEGKPYEFLRQISPRLLEMAEQAGTFARDVSTADLSFRVRDVARRFAEENENARRGYLPPDALPPSRQLPAPAAGGLTPEQIENGKARLQEIRERLAGGMTLPQRGAA
jgi:hypothetical protein